MLLHSSSLLVAIAGVLLFTTAAQVTVGMRHHGRRGTHWWLAANAMLGIAVCLHALGETIDGADALAALLALQWPITTLAGVRRFFSRGEPGVAEWVDRLAFAVAALAVVGTWLAPFESAQPADVYAFGAFALTAYAAFVVGRLVDFATSATLRTLRLALVASAIAEAAWAAIAIAASAEWTGGARGASGSDMALGALLSTVATALLMTQLALAMNHERRVAHLLAAQRKLRHLVDVDALTRLPNRRHFQDLAERAVSASRELATVLVLDVDRLGRINELLGHATGDEALRQIGTALRETLRRRDVAGRLGGDEFAIVLPKTRAADAGVVVGRIKAQLDDRQVAPRIARIELNVGTVQMLGGESIDDALRRARAALAANREQARQGDTVQLQSDAVADDGAGAKAGNDVPTPSALMSLIPVGEVHFR